jgi:phospholipid transport system transporter-binding protein
VIRRCAENAAVAPDAGARVRAVDDGARWSIDGVLTFDTAVGAIDSARPLPLPTAGVVDCAGITAVDSAGVAVLLTLKRRSLAESRELAFVGAPAPLLALADVYGVDELLGIGG